MTEPTETERRLAREWAGVGEPDTEVDGYTIEDIVHAYAAGLAAAETAEAEERPHNAVARALAKSAYKPGDKETPE